MLIYKSFKHNVRKAKRSSKPFAIEDDALFKLWTKDDHICLLFKKVNINMIFKY